MNLLSNDAAGVVSSPARQGAATWQQASNILLIRLDALGDVLMTTPAFNAVRGGSKRHLTLLTSRAGAPLRNHVAALDEVITYDAPWMKGHAHSGAADRRFIGKLARHGFDAAIIFTVCTQSALPVALLCRMAGIPLRLAHSRENPYALLTDWVPETDAVGSGMRHEVTRQLDLVRSVGFDIDDTSLSFNCLASDMQGAQRKLDEAGGDHRRPYVVIHPGSSARSRRYPADRFGRAAQRIVDESGAQIVFTGGADEQAQAIAAQGEMRSPSVSLAGLLTVGELAALIRGARAAVCNNSGPAHLAAAMRTPVVVLYALTNPQHTPWQVPSRVLNHDVPCRWCLKSVCPHRHHACLLGVEAEAVADAALELMQPIGRPVQAGHPVRRVEPHDTRERLAS